MVDLQQTIQATSDSQGVYVSLYDFFETFIGEQSIRLPIKSEHRDMCEALEAAYLGELGKAFICLTMPPRTGKTKLLEALATWALGYVPTAQAILTSYSGQQAELSLAYVARVMSESWYKEIFGDLIRIQRADHIETIQGGNIYAEGVQGSLLGKGAGLKEPGGGFIGVDDPVKAGEALSPTAAKKMELWFENTLLTRRNSDIWTPVIVIAQRLSLLDLVEYLKRTYPSDTLVFRFPCFDSSGKSRFPETWSDSVYEKLNRTRGGQFTLASVYQQDPVAMGGNKIKIDDFRRYSPEDRNMSWDEKLLSADTALKKGQGNDWWVVQCWGRKGTKMYLLDSIRGHWTSLEFIRNSSEFYWKHTRMQEFSPIGRFLIEDTAAGPGVIASLNEAGIPATPVKVIKDKVSRLNDVMPLIEVGDVYIPRDDDMDAAGWLPDFLAECAAFTEDLSHEHDDQCLVAGTLIQCEDGTKPIETVSVGDRVLTRQGFRSVTASGLTGYSRDLIEVITEGRSLIGTPGHPIHTKEAGFVRLDEITQAMTVTGCRMSPSFSQNAGSHSKESPPIFEDRPIITVRRLAIRHAVSVYNLAVEGSNEYLANGILVHNCDAMSQALSAMRGQGISILDVLGISPPIFTH